MICKGIGPEHSPVMVVGDYPTIEETSKGTAFEGTPGLFLSRLFDGTGTKLRECYRTYLYKKYIKPEKPVIFSKKELYLFRERDPLFDRALTTEIATIAPNVILALGEAPLQYFTSKINIRKYQGSILNIDPKYHESYKKNGIKVVPILAVRDIYKEFEATVYTNTFIKKALRYKSNPEPFKERSLLWVCKSYSALYNYLSRNKNPKFVTVDIETYCNFITCISLCCDGYEAISIPIVDSDIPLLERAFTFRLLAQFLNSGVPIVNQNVEFDAFFSKKWGINFTNISDCTMLLANTLYPELPKALDFQTAIHTELTYYKDDGRAGKTEGVLVDDLSSHKERFYMYNAKDALAAWQIRDSLETDAKELKVWDFYQEGPRKFLHVYSKMTDYGIRVDETQRQVLKDKYRTIQEVYREKLESLIDKQINHNSPKQVGNLLYEELALPARTHLTPTGKRVFSTDEDTLEELLLNYSLNKSQIEVCHNILYCRKLDRILQILDMIAHPDGRIKTLWKPSGTDSGRTSTSHHYDRLYHENSKGKIQFQKMGYPLQTFPKHGYELTDGTTIGKDLRSIFVPSPGYAFVMGDLSQAEARVVALLAEDYELLESFDTRDVHVWTAAFILRKLEEQVTREEREKKGKRPRHAGHYDMGAGKLALIARLPKKEANVALERFHEFNPKIRSIFHHEIREFVTKNRFLKNPLGRRRDFFGRLDQSLFRVAYSWIPQSTVSDRTKFSMLYTWEEMPAPDCYFLGEFHDGLLAEVKKGKEEEWFLIARQHMEKPIDFRSCSISRNYNLKIPFEMELSHTNWGAMKKIIL